ncbi:MAG: aminoacyl-tRNA hydrolase [Chloroflexota bacterium]
MYLIAGLGNPGRRYGPTRHNIGFRIVDLLAARAGLGAWKTEHQAETQRIQVEGQAVVVAKPQTFMNESGRALKALMSYYRVDPARLLVVSDDLDLPFGRLRLRARGSAGGHNGLRSVSAELGNQEYARLRAGIGRPTEGEPLDWVLSPFSPSEEHELPMVCETAVGIIQTVLRDGLVAAMNRYNGPSAEAPVARTEEKTPAEGQAHG